MITFRLPPFRTLNISRQAGVTLIFSYSQASSSTMKSNLNTALLSVALLLVSLTLGATAHPKDFQDQPQKKNFALNKQASQVNQQPLIMPHEGDDRVAPMLNDIISIDRAISIFSGLTRSVEEVSARLEDGNQNTTVLAPKNTVITNLPRKPWEDQHDEAEASAKGTVSEELYRGESGEDRAACNLRRFVGAHLVGISPWQKGKANQMNTLQGKTLWWEEEGGVRKIYPDGIVVEQVKDDVPNGQIWVLNGVINY